MLVAPSWHNLPSFCFAFISLACLVMSEGFELAREYHSNLPAHVREYLQQARGICAEVIDLHLLGWNGSRITIPIFDRAGQFAFFKLAKGPNDQTEEGELP